MIYSSKLDLNRFFSALENEKYVIIKLTDFPNYNSGSDIDIFCYNIDKIALEIIYIGKQYLEEDFVIVAKNANDSHKYIDFIIGDDIEFRFDLYGELPEYKRLCVKKDYFTNLIENRVPLTYDYHQKQYNIYVPSLIDELVLRYIEYIEWYELRHDKIKHLNYIMNALSEDEERMIFLDKLHKYTELPPTNNTSIEKQKDTCLKSELQIILRSTKKWIRDRITGKR